ncbi:hypothetical protein ACS60V_03640 [Streptococcus suis]|nr:hypothetical protein [Streptococcus suis]HEM5642209.1 hypothetical protein [Streptococcus suis]
MSITIENVLDFIKNYIEAQIWEECYFKSKGNDNGFENLIESIIPEIEARFDNVKVKLISGHHFPDMDIILNGIKYGVELKSSQKGVWAIPGNSIFESISEDDYSDIFVMFGSRKKDPLTKQFVFQYRIKYKKYWEVTSSISVTHSPRFIINMDSEQGVFASLSEYDEFRKMSDDEKAVFAQKILREKVDGVKWYVAPDIESVQVTNFSELSQTRKDKLLIELLVLFPTDVLRKRNDYTRCIHYLIDKYYVYSKSLRDTFSAGGRIDKNGVLIPQTLQTFLRYKEAIYSVLQTANDEFKQVAYSCWGILPKQDFISDYRLVVDNWVNKEFREELLELEVTSIFDLQE